jgi:hypothetical protein
MKFKKREVLGVLLSTGSASFTRPSLGHASCNSNSCVTDDSVRVGQGKTTV